MQHLDFVIWMTLFPLIISITEYLDSIKPNKKTYSKESSGLSGLFILAVWFYVGYLLF